MIVAMPMPRLGQAGLRPGSLEASCNSLCPGQVCGSCDGVTLPCSWKAINPAARSSPSSHMMIKAACLEAAVWGWAGWVQPGW